MDRENFDIEIKRLESQWPNGYGPERKLILWNAFHKEKTDVFHNAVSDCLAYQRSAPLLDELNKAIEKARTREFQVGQTTRMQFGAQMQDLSKITTADPDFVKMCMRHLSDFQRGKMTKKEFDVGCDNLDRLAEQLTKNRGAHGS